MAPLNQEQNFVLAIVAKAVVLNPPFKSPEVQPWWIPLGQAWLRTLCNRVRRRRRLTSLCPLMTVIEPLHRYQSMRKVFLTLSYLMMLGR